jgi:hypothetical protein
MNRRSNIVPRGNLLHDGKFRWLMAINQGSRN